MSGSPVQVILDHSPENALSQSDEDGLRHAVHYCYGADIDGDLIEFGTFSGRTGANIASSLATLESMGYQSSRHLYLCDSFRGFPADWSEEDRSSPQVESGSWGPGWSFLSPEALSVKIGNLLDRSRFTVVDGWFAETIPNLSPELQFGLLHVDCDLYQSTMDALDPLFRRGQITDGAVICFDDWNCNRASNRYGERLAFARLKETYHIDAEPWGPYGWHGMRYIIHGYNPP